MPAKADNIPITNVIQGDKAGYAAADRGCARSAIAATSMRMA
ncbi:hypothetical protein [Erwinia sp. JUb26]|nr:hypothetical protein [Erwinia sp. JUb26]